MSGAKPFHLLHLVTERPKKMLSLEELRCGPTIFFVNMHMLESGPNRRIVRECCICCSFLRVYLDSMSDQDRSFPQNQADK